MKIKIDNTKLRIIDKSALHKGKKITLVRQDETEHRRSKHTVDLS